MRLLRHVHISPHARLPLRHLAGVTMQAGEQWWAMPESRLRPRYIAGEVFACRVVGSARVKQPAVVRPVSCPHLSPSSPAGATSMEGRWSGAEDESWGQGGGEHEHKARHVGALLTRLLCAPAAVPAERVLRHS